LQLFWYGEEETFLFVRVLFTTFLVKDTFMEREPHSWSEKADKKDAGEQKFETLHSKTCREI
jgi:hypothetical protein